MSNPPCSSKKTSCPKLDFKFQCFLTFYSTIIEQWQKNLFILFDGNTSNFCPIGFASFDWTFNLFSIKEDVITSFFDSWAGYIKRVKKFFFQKIEPRAFKKLINNWSARRTQTAKVNFSSMRQFEELFFQTQLEGRGNFFTQRALFN